MSSIRRQLATFAIVLVALYAIGFVAGQISDPQSQKLSGAEKELRHGH